MFSFFKDFVIVSCKDSLRDFLEDSLRDSLEHFLRCSRGLRLFKNTAASAQIPNPNGGVRANLSPISNPGGSVRTNFQIQMEASYKSSQDGIFKSYFEDSLRRLSKRLSRESLR